MDQLLDAIVNERLGLGAPLLRFDTSSTAEYPRGSILVRQGFRSEDVFYLKRGLIKHEVVHRSIGKILVTKLQSDGSMLNLSDVVLDQASIFSAILLTHSKILRIRGADLRAKLGAYSETTSMVVRELAMQNRELEFCVADICGLCASDRLKAVLVRCRNYKLGGDALRRGERCTIPIAHRELAQIINVTPEHLSRLLRSLEDEGCIVRGNGKLLITGVDRSNERVDLHPEKERTYA